MSHAWQENVLAPERRHTVSGVTLPKVNWFPKCAACGCLVTGAGQSLIYRATPVSEWTSKEPACSGLTKGVTR